MVAQAVLKEAGNANAEMVAWVDLVIQSMREDGWSLPVDLRIAHRWANSAWANGKADLITPARIHMTLHVGDSAIDTGFVLCREIANVIVEPSLVTKLRHVLCKSNMIRLLDLAPTANIPVDADTAYSYCLIRDRGETLPWPPDLDLSHPCAIALAARVRERMNHVSRPTGRGKPTY